MNQLLMKKNSYKYLEQYKDIFGNILYLDESKQKVPQKIDCTSNNSHNLNKYFNKIKNCLECSLGYSRTNFVFGVGNPNSNIVFVGEAPGKNEDLQGEPFVGRGGKLLDKILNAIDLTREDIYILNVLKCRPPENRDPSSEEIQKCEPYLKEQLKIIKPKLIVALGRISAMTLLKKKDSLTNMRNTIHKYEGIDLLVTYHPAAILRNPNFKKPTWEDFKYIKKNYIDGR